MKVFGFESIQPLLDQDGFLFKIVANEVGAILFPHTTEHREMQQPGICYADVSHGNALAAMVVPGRIEFRFHRDFSDERVHRLIKTLLAQPEFSFASTFEVSYQGRVLKFGNAL